MDFKMNTVKVGMMVNGEVFAVRDDVVYVDLKAAYEGVVYRNHLSLDNISSCKEIVKEGDILELKVTKINHDDQKILCSRLDALRGNVRKDFDLQTAHNEEIKATVTRITNGGLNLVKDGIQLFMPASQIDTKQTDLSTFKKGDVLECVVIENKPRNVVVSRRKLLEQKERLAKKAELESLTENQKFTGEVTRIENYGAFVKIGANEGLVHISEISHHHVKDIHEVLSVGEQVEVQILGLEKGKIKLSIKALLPTPWDLYTKEHAVGEEVEGKIVRKMGKGMLVEVAQDVIGLISRENYSWNPNENFAGEVEVGDKVSLKILSMDAKKRKLALSKKHLAYNPWQDVTIQKGEEVSGVVKELQSRGCLVQVQNVIGFLPMKEITEKQFTNLQDVIKEEEVIKALVLDVDKTEWKLVLSIIQLKEQKERKLYEDYLQNEQADQTQTLGDLFGDKLKKFK